MDEKNKQKKDQVHGFRVSFEEGDQFGVHFLQNNLELDEVKPFFHEAQRVGFANFEDQSGVDWKITYNRSEGNYTISRR
jgi:hypothetical protein